MKVILMAKFRVVDNCNCKTEKGRLYRTEKLLIEPQFKSEIVPNGKLGV